MGISLNKQKLMYNVLAPSIITPYKFLWTYGGSGHICVGGWLSVKFHKNGKLAVTAVYTESEKRW